MSFGDVIRSAAAPTTYGMDVGGDKNVIWWCDSTGGISIYLLSGSDIAVVKSGSPPTWSKHIGGNVHNIWFMNDISNIFKLSTTDFSVLIDGGVISSYATGIGGDGGRVWHTEWDWHGGPQLIYELFVIDLSVTRTGVNPVSYPRNVGGSASHIWHSDFISKTNYELSTTDFSIIQSAASPSLAPQGIGGDSNVIWHCDTSTNKIYELAAPYSPPPSTHESHDHRIIVIIPTPPDLVEIKLSGRSLIVEDIDSYSTPEDVPSLIFDNPTEPEQPLYYRSQYTKNVEFTRVFIKGTIASAGDVVYLMTSDQFGQNIFPEVIV